MILDVISRLRGLRIILASASPRRREYLANLGLTPEIVASTFDEKLDKAAFPTAAAYAQETARCKCVEVFNRVATEEQSQPLVFISADTVVEAEGTILEKPADDEDAVRMLQLLSGRWHNVHTAVTILAVPVTVTARAAPGSSGAAASATATASGSSSASAAADSTRGALIERSFVSTTRVRFAALSEPLIRAYVATGEPRDKAGGYGIQGLGGSLVEGIDGDYATVVGLPLQRLCEQLRQLVDVLAPVPL